jgi:predicted transcriptional regulator
MEIALDNDLLEKFTAVAQGPDAELFTQILDSFYERLEEEYFSPEDWEAIREGEEAIERGEYISLEEYERSRGL